MEEKVTRKITISESFLKELEQDARYEVVGKRKSDMVMVGEELGWEVEIAYKPEPITGGARKQELSDRIELEGVPESRLKFYSARGYRIVSAVTTGGKVTAVLEK